MDMDLSDIRGNAIAKRALEVVAAGSHNILIIGPPGAGKTMLAQRLTGLLPPMTDEERRDLVMIWWGACPWMGNGELERLRVRPFRAPHHTCSEAGLIGSKQTHHLLDRRGRPTKEKHTYVVPGEVSLAHNGVLFLDELPEFRRTTLEALGRCLRHGTVDHCLIPGLDTQPTDGWVRIPARPIVVAAMNPCPCGWAGSDRSVCRCGPETIRRYRARVELLLPLFPIRIEVQPQPLGPPNWDRSVMTTPEVAARVRQARAFHTKNAASRAAAEPVAETIAALEGSFVVMPRHKLEARDLSGGGGWPR